MGSVIVSLDAELAWGFHHYSEPPTRTLRHARGVWRRLCQVFDSYEIPATWAITGHLMLDACEEFHSGHPAGERCCEAATDDISAERLWFGNGLVDAVASADVDHEIASHGFTHVHFEHERADRAFVADELAAAVEAATARGFDQSSFVFPVNRVGYRDLLADHGFDCYRGVAPARADRGPIRRRAAKLASGVVGRPVPPVVTPQVDEYGLVNVPASLYLFDFQGLARSILGRVTTDPVVRRAVAGIDAAARTEGVFHVWLHPHDVRGPRDFARLDAVLSHVATRRRSHGLRVETMADAADRVRAER
ncbi:polysaccharide deacetylase family protein [Halorussus ruber]|uniref:polysaccharide deacetylase family protein n=1 Tax=Halorussus ruber TaxID=1126238 RepID=UPI0010931419|nr:polysaccharide deacetylase family protein [Halorussus ruber]